MTDDSRGDRSHGPAPASELSGDRSHGPAPKEPGGSPGGQHPAPGPGHERSDVSIPGIVKFGIGLAVVAAIVQVGLWGLFRLFQAREVRRDEPVPPIVAASLRRTPPEPRLEPDPLAPRAAARAREDAVLESYGWVDRKAGIARIPIDRAMELLVEKGLPPSKPIMPVTPGAPATTPGPAVGSGKPEAKTR